LSIPDCRPHLTFASNSGTMVFMENAKSGDPAGCKAENPAALSIAGAVSTKLRKAGPVVLCTLMAAMLGSCQFNPSDETVKFVSSLVVVLVIIGFVIALVAVVLIVRLVRYIVKGHRDQKEQERKERILNKPLETFGDEASGLADKYKD